MLVYDVGCTVCLWQPWGYIMRSYIILLTCTVIHNIAHVCRLGVMPLLDISRFVIRSRQSEQVRLQGAVVDDNERSCALRYQQSIVEVYAHFYVSIGDEKQYLANR